jgi:transcriptional regulator with XRE-family HTH domain
MPAPTPAPARTFGQAIRAFRRKQRWNQTVLGRRIGVCRDVVGRWEAGAARPSTKSRARLTELARSLPGDAGAALRAALGDGAPAASVSLDGIVHRLAEELDVTTRAFRAAIAALLAASAAAGLTIDQTRKLVAPRVAVRVQVTRRRSPSMGP